MNQIKRCACCRKVEVDDSKLFELSDSIKVTSKYRYQYMHHPEHCESVQSAMERVKNGISQARTLIPAYQKLLGQKEEKPAKTNLTVLNDVSGWVITSAENACFVNKQFLRALRNYCSEMKYQLLIFGIRGSRKSDDNWWDAEIVNETRFGDTYIQKTNVSIVNPQALRPTNQNPLKLAITPPNKISIVPFPKLRLDTTPVLNRHQRVGIRVTTGSVTKPPIQVNSIAAQSRLKQHHYGATVVDKKSDGSIDVRQLSFGSDGSIMDTAKGGVKATAEAVTYQSCVDLVYAPDLHFESLPEYLLEDLTKYLNIHHVNHLVLGDLFNWDIGSHHNTLTDQFIQLVDKGIPPVKMLRNLFQRLKQLDDSCPSTIHVVDSNHHYHMIKWVENFYKSIDVQLLGDHAYLANILYNYAIPHDLNLLEAVFISINKYKPIFKFHSQLDSWQHNGIYTSCHGHKGINGAKFNPRRFAELGIPITVGHIHSPAIYDTSFMVGCTNYQDYADGWSSWGWSLCNQYLNGTRSLNHMLGDTYCDSIYEK